MWGNSDLNEPSQQIAGGGGYLNDLKQTLKDVLNYKRLEFLTFTKFQGKDCLKFCEFKTNYAQRR